MVKRRRYKGADNGENENDQRTRTPNNPNRKSRRVAAGKSDPLGVYLSKHYVCKNGVVLGARNSGPKNVVNEIKNGARVGVEVKGVVGWVWGDYNTFFG